MRQESSYRKHINNNNTGIENEEICALKNKHLYTNSHCEPKIDGILYSQNILE